MLRKLNVYFCLLLLTAGYVNLAISTELCSECEEEIWEEVPCDQVIPNTTTTATYETTTTTTPIPTTITTTTTTPTPTTAPPTTTTQAPVYTTPAPSLYSATTTPSSNPYKNCYCECKLGCKEFCRKVIINSDPKKHITQTSKTQQQIYPGSVQIKHVHERTFVPSAYIAKKYQQSTAVPVTVPEPIPSPKSTVPVQDPVGSVYPIENSAEIDHIYDSGNPAINSVSSAAAAAYPGGQQSNYYHQQGNFNTPPYSLEELTKLLTSQIGYNNQPHAYYSQNQQQQGYNQQTYGSEATPPVPTYASPQYSQQQNEVHDANDAYYQPSQAYQPSQTYQPSLNAIPSSQQPQSYAQQYSQIQEPNVASYSNGPAGNSATTASAAVASSVISDAPNANYHLSQNGPNIAENNILPYPQDSSYSNPALNENIPPHNFNLDSYLKDYVYSHQTSVNAYPDHQLSYPSY